MKIYEKDKAEKEAEDTERSAIYLMTNPQLYGDAGSRIAEDFFKDAEKLRLKSETYERNLENKLEDIRHARRKSVRGQSE